MTKPDHDRSPDRGAHADVPLEPWMLALVREVVDERDAQVEVPREMMWARVQRARGHHDELARATPGRGGASREAVKPAALPRAFVARQWVAAAAVLVAGVAIGRYAVPKTDSPLPVAVLPGASVETHTSIVPVSSDPSHVAMQEHLGRTVALLTSVLDGTAKSGGDTALALRAKALLSTTRLLLDQPQLRDDRTRRLLQDLELVLVQVVQARSTAPETQRAPRETLRETNLLTRVNALVTASTANSGAIYGGD